MSGRLVLLVAGTAMACLIVAALIFQQRWPSPDTGAIVKSLGPRGEAYAFTAEPAGRGGPTNDCVVCHSIAQGEAMRSAPSLWGIVGAPKARAAWFGYSLALRKKGGVWNEDELDKYLANPSGFVPGTLKTLPPITDPVRRREVIAFLKSLHG
jgi:cytochrome c